MGRFALAALGFLLAPSVPALACEQAQASSAASGSRWNPRDIAFGGTIRLRADATDVERGIVKVEESIPLSGQRAMTLLFPTWVPGNHAPTARVDQLTGLVLTAGGKRVAWQRDPVDMHAFHVVLPEGVPSLEARFDILTPVRDAEGRIAITPDLMNLQWFSLALTPAGHFARRIKIAPSVRLPQGWTASTQMPLARRDGQWWEYATLDFESLLDAPLFAGRHSRRFEIGSIAGAPVRIDAFADRAESLEATPATLTAHRNLVLQAGRLLGAPPFHDYRFLLGLSEDLGGIGTEHLASSEVVQGPDYLRSRDWGQLLAHEFVHSWNGKARRPADSWSADFNQPIRNSMLWLYEGQTAYWAFVLSARAGLSDREKVGDIFARIAARYARQPRGAWRPLADTGNDAIISRYLTEEPWPSWHGELNDSYNEAALMWLEADLIIRRLSNDRRSLDDFARSFFSGGGAHPSLYTRQDVEVALTRVQPFDWHGFLDRHLDQPSVPSAQAWFEGSGYRLAFGAVEPDASRSHHERTGRLELSDSLGAQLAAGGSGTVRSVLWGGPAFRAGLVAGATILSIDGQPYSDSRLMQAIRGRRPVRLRANIRGHERDMTVDYAGGLRFPFLDRVPGVPDRLGDILRPL